MRGFRFSIAGLIALVGIAATGFAAVRVASPGWSGGLFSLTILALLTAVLGIIYRRGPKRVFWVGFAIFGWTHLILASAPWFSRYTGPQLLGSKLFTQLFPILHPNAANAGMMGMGGMGMGGMGGMGGGGMGGGFRQIAMGGMGMVGMGGAAPAPGTFVYLQDFTQIGQSLEALIWAFLGGWAATYLSRGREPAPAETVREPRPPE
jgi:hypothetical protein